jgi:hypothetical protein
MKTAAFPDAQIGSGLILFGRAVKINGRDRHQQDAAQRELEGERFELVVGFVAHAVNGGIVRHQAQFSNIRLLRTCRTCVIRQRDMPFVQVAELAKRHFSL